MDRDGVEPEDPHQGPVTQLMSTEDMVSCLLIVPPGNPDEVRRAILDFRDQTGPYDRELVLVVRLVDAGPDHPPRERTDLTLAAVHDLIAFIREHDPGGYVIHRYVFVAHWENEGEAPRTEAERYDLAAGSAHGPRHVRWDPAVRHPPDWLVSQKGEAG